MLRAAGIQLQHDLTLAGIVCLDLIPVAVFLTLKLKAVCAEGGLGTAVYDAVDALGFIGLVKDDRNRGIGTDVVGVGVIGNKPRTGGGGSLFLRIFGLAIVQLFNEAVQVH